MVDRPAQELEVQVDELDGGNVVRLTGELDMATAPAVQEALHAAQHAQASQLIVDLRGLTFLDSVGLGVLIAADLAGRDGHVKVSFVRGSPTVHRVFELTKVDERVEGRPTGLARTGNSRPRRGHTSSRHRSTSDRSHKRRVPITFAGARKSSR